ncbi:MAG: GTP-binding protein [Pirellulaceae bacterium]|nr:GTP-binding protein [Pirellulaceae bacterium]
MATHTTQRFFDRLNQEWNGVLRSKGFFWLASRLDKIGVWSQAGRVASLNFGGFWWAAVPPEHWLESSTLEAEVEQKWHPEVGDCRDKN